MTHGKYERSNVATPSYVALEFLPDTLPTWVGHFSGRPVKVRFFFHAGSSMKASGL